MIKFLSHIALDKWGLWPLPLIEVTSDLPHLDGLHPTTPIQDDFIWLKGLQKFSLCLRVPPTWLLWLRGLRRSPSSQKVTMIHSDFELPDVKSSRKSIEPEPSASLVFLTEVFPSSGPSLGDHHTNLWSPEIWASHLSRPLLEEISYCSLAWVSVRSETSLSIGNLWQDVSA